MNKLQTRDPFVVRLAVESNTDPKFLEHIRQDRSKQITHSLCVQILDLAHYNLAKEM